MWGCESERAPGSESWRLSAKREAALEADSSLDLSLSLPSALLWGGVTESDRLGNKVHTHFSDRFHGLGQKEDGLNMICFGLHCSFMQ